MAWTYLKFDEEGELIEGSPNLPGERTAYLGFDAVRSAVVLGYTERGGYHSMLAPNVDDDCMIVAYAPLSESSDPDIEIIKANVPSFDGTTTVKSVLPILLR